MSEFIAQLYPTLNMVDEICGPLFTKTPYQYFSYCCYYSDGSFITLTNSSICKIAEFVLSRHLYPSAYELNHFFDVNQDKTTEDQSVITTISDDMSLPCNLINQRKYEANIDFCVKQDIRHRTFLFNKNANCIESFCFGTKNSGYAIFEYTLANIEYLKKFLIYFMELAKPTLQKLEQNKLILTCFHDHCPESTGQDSLNKNSTEWGSILQLDHLTITLPHQDIEITYKLAKILHYYVNGYSSKEIASIFKLSARTIESHIGTLKNLFHTHSRAGLRNIYLNSQLPAYFK